MSWVELVDRPWKNMFFMISACFLVILFFQTLFLRWLEIPRGSIYSFTKQYIFGGWWLVFVGYESSLNGIAFWASFSTMICWPSSFGCWIVWIQPHRKPTWKWKITFFKWLGFPVVILVFRGFSIWFVEILLLRLFGSNPSSSWKEISSPLLQKLPWRKFRMISYVSP